MPMGSYLDLDFLINGFIDASLLVFTGRILHLPIRFRHIAAGAAIGEVPVLLAFFAPGIWLTLSKFLIPVLMIWVAFPTQKLRVFFKALLGFWILATGLGGFTVALWGGGLFQNATGSRGSVLNLDNLWLLPLVVALWWGIQRVWEIWKSHLKTIEQMIYDVEISFGEGGEPLKVKALLDTGNQLKDPVTGAPIILLEEEVAAAAMPDIMSFFLKIPWRESENPWSFLWKDNLEMMKHIVFIPYKAIGKESWLLGVRPERIVCFEGAQAREIKATVALVQQNLNVDGEYQALLHPEHLQKGVC